MKITCERCGSLEQTRAVRTIYGNLCTDHLMQVLQEIQENNKKIISSLPENPVNASGSIFTPYAMWESVKDRLPVVPEQMRHRKQYLTVIEDHGMDFAVFIGLNANNQGIWQAGELENIKVTHWLDFPKDS